MAHILNLETASTNCSVSIFRDEELLALREDPSPKYTHGELLHIFIREALEEAGLQASDLSAVAVSKGPGSYTGLRIGVSAAKGICFALGIPLIALPTLKVLAEAGRGNKGLLVPVLDARRMEVYSALFDSDLNEVRETRAEVIGPDSFAGFRSRGPLHLLGDGAEKLREVLGEDGMVYHTGAQPSARLMGLQAYTSFRNDAFEDTAYFEPFYLKDFIPSRPKAADMGKKGKKP